MPRVAFYAPMKSPTHAVPSGDREMARNLMAAIGAGGAVELVSELRVYDGKGDLAYQTELAALASDEIQRLSSSLGDADLWVTYHNYYKAPDLIGPAVSRALNLPYVQIESTRARKRLTGPWAGFAAAAEAATDAADVVFYMTAHDRVTLERDRADGQSLVHLPPFLPQTNLPDAADCSTGPMLSVAMMRDGDKLASYRIIADTLALLDTPNWQLEIAGDGPARAQVQTLMAPFGDQVRFLGQLNKSELAAAYARAALFLWPGVNEAYGMVYLEAQAAGLPVLAQNRPGVRDVVLAGNLVPPEGGPPALAQELGQCLGAAGTRRRRATLARKAVAQSHLIGSATRTIWSALTPLLERRT